MLKPISPEQKREWEERVRLPPLKDPNTVYDQVKTEYLKHFHLIWAQPLGFNNTFPVVREEVYPKIKDVLSKLEGLISAEEMRHLNFLVDAQQLSAHEAVARLLKEKNF